MGMYMDIDKKNYSKDDFYNYIYGSSHVVCLMCLSVFIGGNKKKYENLKS